MLGFESGKDLLDVVLIPAIGGLIALLWPSLQALDKRRRFGRLVQRELQETDPYPKERSPEKPFVWTDHQTRTFVHQRILDDATANRDFILSLDPTLVYHVTQLWEARRTGNSVQWLYYLEELSKRYGGDVSTSYARWKKLIQGS